ncbi:phosphoglycerate mutase [Flavobacterium sp. 316]|uniref:alpha-ribazole phosphatase n=1 Tax=Flavobacterium sp. 316 TaxID=1603293 RepID=UPI0005DF5B44|nr:alpha-ribazole phosphatase [Flavobacterium sp. 316]KIX22215.1 phosphoglycerate mutase [Flavobacterium sp. 316]
MEVYLIRHTETVCEKGICYGQADVAIQEPFEHLFQEIKDQLPSEEMKVISSPLKRCTVLADFLSNEKIEKDKRLMEMDFGNWELKNWNDIPQEELNPWMKDFVSVQVPNGESFEMLYERTLSFIEDLKKQQHKKVAIVTHAGVIRSFLCYQQNLPLKEAFQNKVTFGQIIKIIL